MGSFLGNAVFAACLFFYFLGVIFTVVSYLGAWLEPRNNFNSNIEMISIRQACFAGYEFAIVNNQNTKTVTGCRETTRNSPDFQDADPKSYSPEWYRRVQDMHLASIIMQFLALILAIGFLISYGILNMQLRKRRRPSSSVLLSKAGLSLWFILTFITALLQAIEPGIFYQNYEQEKKSFFPSSTEFQYGPGIFVGIAGAVSLLISSVLGLVVCVTVMRKMARLSGGDAKDEFANLDPNDTELERLSHDEIDQDRHEDNGTSVAHKKAYPVAAPRRPQSMVESNEERSYQNIPKQKKKNDEPFQSNEHSYHNIPQSKPRTTRDQYATEPNTQHNYPRAGFSSSQQGAATPMESNLSTDVPSSVFTNTPQYLSRDGPSDTESQVSGRSRSVARSGAPIPTQRSDRAATGAVVMPSRAGDFKHSRYAAY